MDSYLIRSQLLWGFTKFKSYEQSFVNVCTWPIAQIDRSTCLQSHVQVECAPQT